jgi:methylated-DNA-protein-cysteine methyltransferase related protein
MTSTRKSFEKIFLPSSHTRSPSRRSIEENPSLQAIWDVISALPRGKVATYGGVARAAGLPGRARLTGYALRVMPPIMNYPWHRVVGAGGRISFPKSSPKHKEQARLLRAEGVTLTDGRVNRAFIDDFE